MGMLAVAVVFAVGAVFGKRDAKWNGFPEALDALLPGMTMEEARSVFPGNSLFAAEAADGCGEHTWVTDLEAEAVRVLHVEAEDPEELATLQEGFVANRSGGREGGFGGWRHSREESVPDWSGGVDMYFDGEGRLVGVHEYMTEGGNWRAGWGVLDRRPREVGGEERFGP